MSKRDLEIHLDNGEVLQVDKANVLWVSQATFTVTGGSNDIDTEVVGAKKVLIARECVCRVEAGPDAYTAKEKVWIFEYWNLDGDGNRTGNRAIRFALHVSWSDAAVYMDDIVAHLTGGATNQNPNLSLGGTLSAFDLLSGPVDTVTGMGLFDDITEAEYVAGDTEYRVIRLENFGSVPVTLNVWIENPDNPDPAMAKDSDTNEIWLAEDKTAFVSAAANENTDPGPEGSYGLETQSSPLASTAIEDGAAGVGIVLKRIVIAHP